MKNCENKRIKVYEGTGVNTRVPRVNLQGKWLDELGFSIGKSIEVVCARNMIVITLKEADEKNKPMFPVYRQ